MTLDLSPERSGKAERSREVVSDTGNVGGQHKSGELGRWQGAGAEKVQWRYLACLLFAPGSL